MPLKKVVSGGQTGVDRGALDAALDAGFPCGGWCPGGREAEDGAIPLRYPLTPLAEAGYRQRTIQNVIDSDATLVIYFDALQGGTGQTVMHCARRQRPYMVIDGAQMTPARAALLANDFVAAHAVSVLNVAGPRASRNPEAHEFAYRTVTELLRLQRETTQSGA